MGDFVRPLVEVSELRRRYPGAGDAVVEALRGISFDIQEGEFLAVTGPSGCGKSTLLNLLAALDTADAGGLRVGTTDLRRAGETERTRYRREDVGIVFQFFNLLPGLTVEENVALPLRLCGVPVARRLARARELLGFVGMGERVRHYPHQLSGGELQRTAVARALVHEPKLLIADEPTGNLDSEATGKVLDLFRQVYAAGLSTIVLVTHSEIVANAANRRLHLQDGAIQRDIAAIKG